MSTDDRPSQLSPTEEAKQRSMGLGAPVVPSPGSEAVGVPPLPQHPQQAPVTPPGPNPTHMQQFQPMPVQYPQQMTPIQQAPQAQPLTPGQGMSMQQFAQAAGQGQQPQRLPPEQFKEGLQALSEAQQREASRQKAEPIPIGPTEDEAEPPEDDEDSPLLQSMDEDLASALDRFNNRPRRKKIESKLTAMNAEDLIIHGEIRQEVPISAGLRVTFRTTSGLEHDGMLDELGNVAANTSGSELFLRERLANYNLTLSVYQIGDRVLPSHLEKDGEFSIEGFRKKFKEIMRKPLLLIADMRVNCYWFDERVRRVMVADELGNG